MKARQADGGAAGFADAAAAHHGGALWPRALGGVTQLSPDEFAFVAPVNGRDIRIGGFCTAAAAAEGYEEIVRALRTPTHPGEKQAVPAQCAGEAEPLARLPEAQKKLKVSPPPAAVPAASPPEALAPAAPQLYRGVVKKGAAAFFAVALFGSKQQRKGPFCDALTAAQAYDKLMRDRGLVEVNFPRLPGEVQAVRDGTEQALLRHCEQEASRPRLATAPAPVKGVEQLKGVYQRTHRFETSSPSKEYLGKYDTAEEAAAVYDAHVRKTSGGLPPVVNTPLYAGEIQAVKGEPEAVTRERAAAVDAQPCRASRLPAPADALAPTPEDAWQYKGVSVKQRGDASRFSATARCGRVMELLGTFDTAEEAADVYDAHVRQRTPAGVAPVVNTPLHAGEIQAVPGAKEDVTRQRASDAARGSLPLARAEDAWQYKGVRMNKNHFAAAARCGPVKQHLGRFGTAKEAADAYDAYARKKTPAGLAPVVNTPLHAGELQAVPDEKDSVTRQRAADEAPAEPEPEPKRPRLSNLPVPQTPAPPQQALALAPAAPAPAAAISSAAAGDCDDDLVVFLRAISPPLTEIDRVAAAAADAGMRMSHLRDAVRAPPFDGASKLHMIYDILGICRGADKMALMQALLPMA